MEIIMYILIFLMGTVFGSFYTLAVYRIPLKKDITHERSFCPNCGHKLGFFDMIPIFSYVFLGGKCRYCKTKIRVRYLLLEIMSGLVFLIAYISLNMNFPYFMQNKIAYLIAFAIFYTVIVLVSGIDKEYRTINKSVIVFGIIAQFFYMLYLYITSGVGMYRYNIYLIMIIFIFILDKVIKKNEKNGNYIIELIYYCLYINMFIVPSLFTIIVLLTLVFCLWKKVINVVKTNVNLKSIDEKDDKNKIQIGYYLGISTIITILIQNFTYYWR